MICGHDRFRPHNRMNHSAGQRLQLKWRAFFAGDGLQVLQLRRFQSCSVFVTKFVRA
jgi:hypothetical protein